jgi:predicted nucleic acid-binding Zn ribbon protein
VKKCEGCGARILEPKRYCGRACAALKAREVNAHEAKCVECGATFTATAPHTVRCSETCSNRMRTRARRIRRKEK